MASIRQIFTLYMLVTLLCHFGESHKVSKRHVGGLFAFFKKFLHSLHYPVSSYSNSHDFSKLKDDFLTPWNIDNSISDESRESDYFFLNPFGDDSHEIDFDRLENKKYHLFKEDDAKHKRGDKQYGKHDVPKKAKDSNLNKIKNDELNPEVFLSTPAVPKTNAGPIFIPIVPSTPISFPVNFRNNGAPYTGQPNNMYENFIPKINNVPIRNILLSNGGKPNGFNKGTIPNYGNFGTRPISNYIPTGAPNYNSYYPNVYPGQQKYYLVQLSNGQVVWVPEKALLASNNRPRGPGYGPIFLPNNNPIFAPGQYPLQNNDYLLPFIYEQLYGQYLPRPRRGGILPGGDQRVPFPNEDYLKLLKHICKDLFGNGKTGVGMDDKEASFIDQDLWRFGDSDTVSSSAIKDEAKIKFPEDN